MPVSGTAPGGACLFETAESGSGRQALVLDSIPDDALGAEIEDGAGGNPAIKEAAHVGEEANVPQQRAQIHKERDYAKQRGEETAKKVDKAGARVGT
eukprot:594328-Pyramimonas_sp.AAC.1